MRRGSSCGNMHELRASIGACCVQHAAKLYLIVPHDMSDVEINTQVCGRVLFCLKYQDDPRRLDELLQNGAAFSNIDESVWLLIKELTGISAPADNAADNGGDLNMQTLAEYIEQKGQIHAAIKVGRRAHLPDDEILDELGDFGVGEAEGREYIRRFDAGEPLFSVDKQDEQGAFHDGTASCAHRDSPATARA